MSLGQEILSIMPAEPASYVVYRQREYQSYFLRPIVAWGRVRTTEYPTGSNVALTAYIEVLPLVQHLGALRVAPRLDGGTEYVGTVVNGFYDIEEYKGFVEAMVFRADHAHTKRPALHELLSDLAKQRERAKARAESKAAPP